MPADPLVLVVLGGALYVIGSLMGLVVFEKFLRKYD